VFEDPVLAALIRTQNRRAVSVPMDRIPQSTTRVEAASPIRQPNPLACALPALLMAGLTEIKNYKIDPAKAMDKNLL